MENELHEIGEAVLAVLRGNTIKTIFDIWYRDLILEAMEDGRAVFSIPSSFKRDYLTQHYAPVVEAAVRDVMGHDITVEFTQRESDWPPKPKEPTPPPVHTDDPPLLPQDEEEQPSVIAQDIENPKTIVSRYTFENFIVADSNRFAYSAAMGAARFACTDNEENMNLCNPLFIYGKSGLGKTHLLYAITNEIKKKNPSVKIVYKKGEDFTTEFLSALEKNSQATFRSYYRKADVLLIDDIQFIAGKEQTQIEFFHTFSALYEEGKQIILTSDRPPREIRHLEERLLSRFEWGQMADIQPPSGELRTAIILKKSGDMGMTLPQDVVAFLSDNLTENIRQIEGALNRLKGVSAISRTPITLEMCRRTVSDFIHSNTSTSDTMDRIFRVVSQRYRVSPDEIKGKSRKENIATARHISIYLARQITDLSQSAIGAYFDRDHTTVLNSIKTVEKNMAENSAFSFEVEELLRELRS